MTAITMSVIVPAIELVTDITELRISDEFTCQNPNKAGSKLFQLNSKLFTLFLFNLILYYY